MAGGPAIYEAEYRGERMDDDDKIVVREARLLKHLATWNKRSARLFVCDCAERVVHLCDDDDRPRDAIAVARRFANSEATQEDLTAARDAAWDAARARAAARDAARDVAWAAAWDAAWDAEREWQTERLMEYLHVTR
jgi:hypothetical protein